MRVLYLTAFATASVQCRRGKFVVGVLFEVVQTVPESPLVVLGHVGRRCQLQVGPPVGGVETPVTRVTLLVAVRVRHELLRVELMSAVDAAHYARRRTQRPRALAEAAVHHGNRDVIDEHWWIGAGGDGALTAQQGTAESLGVGQRY